jgi:hypothetical protein
MPIALNPHLGKGGTGFHGTKPGTAAYFLLAMASQGQAVVTGGAAEAQLDAAGLKTTSVITSAVMFASGVPSIVTVASIPANGKVTFVENTTGNVVLLEWVDPPQ